MTSRPKVLQDRLGALIRTERERQGISQVTLALHAGIDRSYIGRIERGEVSLTVNKLYLICGVLGVSPAGILPQFPLIVPPNK